MKEITKEDILNWKATPKHDALWDAIFLFVETVCPYVDWGNTSEERTQAVINLENKLQEYVESKK